MTKVFGVGSIFGSTIFGEGDSGAVDTSGLLYDWDTTAIDSGTTWSTTGTKSLGGITSWNVRNAGSNITVDGNGITLTAAAELSVDDITEVISGFDASGKVVGFVMELSTNYDTEQNSGMIGQDYNNIYGVGMQAGTLKAIRKTGGAFAGDVNEGGYTGANVYTLGCIITAGTAWACCDYSGAAVSDLLPLGPLSGAPNYIGGATNRAFTAAGGIVRWKSNTGTMTITRMRFYDLTGSTS